MFVQIVDRLSSDDSEIRLGFTQIAQGNGKLHAKVSDLSAQLLQGFGDKANGHRVWWILRGFVYHLPDHKFDTFFRANNRTLAGTTVVRASSRPSGPLPLLRKIWLLPLITSLTC